MPAARIEWKPLWAVVGCALPLSFAQQIEPALYYLKKAELVHLYGTEWLLFVLLGSSLTIAVWLIGPIFTVTQRNWRNVPARIGIVVVISSITLGVMTIAQIHTRSIVIVGTALVCAALLPEHLLVSDYMRQMYVTLQRISQLGAVSVIGAGLVGLPGAVQQRLRPPSLPGPDERPNIVLITIDTLSAEHLSLYGARRPTSPQLEIFARESILFTRAYANGNFTTEGISSILTGTRPWTHRAIQAPGKPRVIVSSHALPGRLRAAGYVTAAVSTNPWASPRRLGLASQFDKLFSDRVAAVSGCSDTVMRVLPYACAALQNAWLASLNALFDTWRLRMFFRDNRQYNPATAIAEATRWLRQERIRPVFLWVHLVPPHDPYAAPKPWLQSFEPSDVAVTASDSHAIYGLDMGRVSAGLREVLEKRYEESIAYVDHSVGMLISQTKAILGDNTCIIVSADHGESFRHGYGGHGGPGLFDEIIHIPLVLSVPKRFGLPGMRRDLVAQIDIAPTVAQLAGIDRSPDWEGESLLTPHSGPLQMRTIYSMNFEQSRSHGALLRGCIATLRGDWKLIQCIGDGHYPEIPLRERQLFNISSDPLEMRNSVEEQPALVRDLQSQTTAEFAKHRGPVVD